MQNQWLIGYYLPAAGCRRSRTARGTEPQSGEGEVTEERQSAPRLARTCHFHVVLRRRKKKKFLKAHDAWFRRIQDELV